MPAPLSPLRKKREDRPIYVPQQRRMLMRRENRGAGENESRVVELLGRYGRIDQYEFEFSHHEDAARAAASLSRYGDFTEGGASLVRHVEAPRDDMICRKAIRSRVMEADLEASSERSAGQPGRIQRRLLDDHELLLPSSQWNAPWRPTSLQGSSSAYGQDIMTKNGHGFARRITDSPSCPPSIPKFRLTDRYSRQEQRPARRGNTDEEETSAIPELAVEPSSAQSHVKSRTTRSCGASSTDKAAPAASFASLTLDVACEPHKEVVAASTAHSTTATAFPSSSFKAFEHEMCDKFPSAFSLRLLIAMWVSLCRSGLQMSAISGTGASVADTSDPASEVTPTEGSLLSPSPTSSRVVTVDSAMDYFKTLLERLSVTVADVPLEAQREASHFVCYLCILLGDLCRYRDVHIAKYLQKGIQRGCLPYEEYQKRHGELFTESIKWYRQASERFPQESRIYTQLSDLYFRKSDLLGQISATLRSIICAFRNRNEDVLTVLLETGSTACGKEVFASRLLSLVQSLYCKIGLDQFDSRIETLSTVLRDLISASISSALLDTLLTAFQLLILMMVETSSLWQHDAELGDVIDHTVKSIKLKLVHGDDGEPVFCLNDVETDYAAVASRLRNHYQSMTLIYAQLFRQRPEAVINLIESSERFTLTCITLCRLTLVVTESVRSPLSPLLGILSTVFLWLSSTGSLFLYDEHEERKETTLSQIKVGYRALRETLALLKEKLSDLLFCCGKELLEAEKLQDDMLQYSLPEDQYLSGCVAIPVQFCIASRRSPVGYITEDDSQGQTPTVSFCASLVIPFSPSTSTFVSSSYRRFCCCPEASSNVLQCCVGQVTDHPEFVNVIELLQSTASSSARTGRKRGSSMQAREMPACAVSMAPHHSSRSYAEVHREGSFTVEETILSSSGADDDDASGDLHERSNSDDELEPTEESCCSTSSNDSSNDHTSRSAQDEDGYRCSDNSDEPGLWRPEASNAREQQSPYYDTHVDIGHETSLVSNTTHCVYPQPSHRKDASTLREEHRVPDAGLFLPSTEKSALLQSSVPRVSRGSSADSTLNYSDHHSVNDDPNTNRPHRHVAATLPCLSNLVSLVRLSRLLVIAGSLDEFRAKCVSTTPRITNLGTTRLPSEAVESDAVAEAGAEGLLESSGLVQNRKCVDQQGDEDASGRERRGLLRVKSTVRQVSTLPRCERAGDHHHKEEERARRSRRKLWTPGTTDAKVTEAEARLFPAATGGQLAVRPRRSAVGHPRAPLCARPPLSSSSLPSQPVVSHSTPSKQPLGTTTVASELTVFTSPTPRPPYKPTCPVPELTATAGNVLVLPPEAESTAAVGPSTTMLLMTNPGTTSSERPKKRTLIVIDGSNVAHRHGSATSKKFSSAGIQITLDYYLKRGFDAIAFVPEYVTSYKDVGDNRRLQKAGVKGNTASKIPDDVQLLRDLSDQGLLITTPPQDYDDSYIIQYAMNHGGFIVSNDRYRDHKRKESSEVRRWLKSHLISFTFISDEFMPNPDFVFPDDNV